MKAAIFLWLMMLIPLHAEDVSISASSVHSSSYPPSDAVDGIGNTRWASFPGVKQEWIQIDFGRSCRHSGVKIVWEHAYALEYEVQLSDDGKTWKTVFSRKDGKGGTEDCRFDEQAARYLRVVCSKTGKHGLYSIWEIEPVHPDGAALVREGHDKVRKALAEKAIVINDVLAGNGIKEIVFALRKRCADGHWYANIGYWAESGEELLSEDFGRLCKYDVASSNLTVLVDDPAGSVRDPVISYDGRKILFSYRKGGTRNFLLYEMSVDPAGGSGLKQITTGKYDDIEPAYLPDGGIIFVSTRSRRWVNCWATQVATIHRCDGDGGNIRQLSANLEQDNTPWVLPDGRILYQRWEYIDRSQVDYHHLWTMNPDGTGQMVYYGNMLPGSLYIDAKPVPDSTDVLMINSPGHGEQEHEGSVALVTDRMGPDEPTAKRVVRKARSRDPYPFSRDYYIAASAHDVVLADYKGNERAIFKVPAELTKQGISVHEPRPVMARKKEPVIPTRVDLSKNTGTMLLDNVYFGRNMAGIPPGSIRKLLVMESLPKPINFTGGMDPLTYGGSFTLVRILGTVPVEADGSAHFEVPANRSLFLIALDGEDKSVKRMQSFMTVMPGERASCVGCHENRSASPVVSKTKKAAFAKKPSRIEPVEGIPDVFDYPRDIQPILDKNCVSCHNPDEYAGKVNLTGGRGPFYSLSYAALTIRRQFIDGRDQAKSNYAPYTIGATPSPLMKKLDGEHHDVKLSTQEKKMIKYWIEAGAPYIGTYAGLGTGCLYGYARNEQKLNNLDALPETEKGKDAVTKRCSGCHVGDIRLPRTLGDENEVSFWRPKWTQPALFWAKHVVFNLTQPEKSTILLGPMSTNSGGYGACKLILPDGKYGEAVKVFSDKTDPDYISILEMIKAGQKKLDEVKRFDMPGFKPRPEYIREMIRYGVLPQNYDTNNPAYTPYQIDRMYWDEVLRNYRARKGSRQ